MSFVPTSLLTLALVAASSFLTGQTPTRLAQLEAAAQNPSDLASLKALGETTFSMAVGGDRCVIEKALEAHLSLIQVEPAAAIHQSRLGSLFAMKGREAALPMARVWYVKQGLEAMAKAVALAPEDPGVRLTRASTCAALPALFDQLGTAIEDCQHLDRRMSATPQAFPKSLVCQTRLLLGSSLLKAGRTAEGRMILESVAREGAGTPFATKAQELLK